MARFRGFALLLCQLGPFILTALAFVDRAHGDYDYEYGAGAGRVDGQNRPYVDENQGGVEPDEVPTLQVDDVLRSAQERAGKMLEMGKGKAKYSIQDKGKKSIKVEEFKEKEQEIRELKSAGIAPPFLKKTNYQPTEKQLSLIRDYLFEFTSLDIFLNNETLHKKAFQNLVDIAVDGEIGLGLREREVRFCSPLNKAVSEALKSFQEHYQLHTCFPMTVGRLMTGMINDDSAVEKAEQYQLKVTLLERTTKVTTEAYEHEKIISMNIP